MKIKNILFLLCLISSSSIYAQSKVKVGLKMNLGPYGLSEDVDIFSEDVDIQDVGTYFNIGLTSHAFLSSEKRFSIGLDFLYNSSAFTYRPDIFSLLSTYSMKNVLIPLKANYHFEKWIFSAGLINSFVIEAKTKNDEFQVKDGELYISNGEYHRLAFLNKKYDLQGTFGGHYAVSSKVNLGLETTFYFAENDFYSRKYFNYPFKVKNFNYASISFAVSYFMN